MVSREKYLMGRDVLYPLDATQEANLLILLPALNAFAERSGLALLVTSGYRPPSINATVPGAAKHSNHTLCLACDFRDHDGSRGKWCLNNLHVLEEIGLWLENPLSTPGWIHLQAIAPHSGKRVFLP